MKVMPVSNLKMPKWVAAGRILLNSYCITHKFQLEKGSFFSTLQIEPYPKVLTIWNTCWTITKSIVLVSNEFLWNLSQKFKLSKWPIKPFFWIFESICGKVGIFLSFTCLKCVYFMVLTFATWYNYSKVSKHTCPTLWGIQGTCGSQEIPLLKALVESSLYIVNNALREREQSQQSRLWRAARFPCFLARISYLNVSAG